MAKSGQRSKTLTGLAGEYHVLSQLAERGIETALTLGTTKSVDILAHNPLSGRHFRVEVKTTCKPPRNDKIFGTYKFYCWTMSENHEAIEAPDLIYCFVHLQKPGTSPNIYVVPSKSVAKYVRDQHQQYRKARKLTGPDANTMRTFRVPEHDPEKLAKNWTLFD